jgi:hypothetical protein
MEQTMCSELQEEMTEAEALSDWLYAFEDDDDDDHESREQRKTDARNATIKSYTTQYEANKKAKVGTEIICPVCRKKFIKKNYQQAFCVRTDRKQKHRCKDIYWNSVSDVRRDRAEFSNKNH